MILFSLKNICATYQRAINLIFHNTINHNIEVYIDDIMVKSKSKSKHLDEINSTFKSIRVYNLKMNPLKCTFKVQVGNF